MCIRDSPRGRCHRKNAPRCRRQDRLQVHARQPYAARGGRAGTALAWRAKVKYLEMAHVWMRSCGSS
eukprot:12776405-Alexandrium_andersonii.AAC.1